MIKHIHDSGRKVAALCGSPSQARKHADAASTSSSRRRRGRWHSGEVGSIVLWRRSSRKSLQYGLAAGGIGSGQQIAAALALGAQGAWTGSQWLMARRPQHPGSAGDVHQGRQPRHRPQSFLHGQAGPDAAQAWTELGRTRTTRSRLVCRCSTWFPHRVRATNRYPNESVDVAFNRSVRSSVIHQGGEIGNVIARWVQEYLEATNRLDELNEAATV